MTDRDAHRDVVDALTSLIEGEMDAVADADVDRLQSLVAEKEVLASRLEAAAPEIEVLLRGDTPRSHALRDALAELQTHLKRNSTHVSRMARSCAEIVAELTRGSHRAPLRGLYDYKGKTAPAISVSKDVDLSL